MIHVEQKIFSEYEEIAITKEETATVISIHSADEMDEEKEVNF